MRANPAVSRPRHAQDRSDSAVVKLERKVGSTLPTFSAHPIDRVVLSNLNDVDLLSNAKRACSIHTQAGAYAKEFLAELKRRFNKGKELRNPYLGYKNFDKLCADSLEIGARQVRNILNDNPDGRKGRSVGQRPSVAELEAVKTENKRLKGLVKQVGDANDRIVGGQGGVNSGCTKQDIENAKKDARRDHLKITVKEKKQSDDEVEALKKTVDKLTQENHKLQKQHEHSFNKPSSMLTNSTSLIEKPWAATRDEVIHHAVSIIRPFSISDRRLIIEEIESRLHDLVADFCSEEAGSN
jgi:hypothetical protein